MPGIAYTEAGHIECATAGFTEVAEAITAIQGKDILLNIGQELPEGKELELIKSDLDYYLQTKRLLFCYNGMHWRKKDRPLIREIHRAADAYWNEKILSNSDLECQEK